MDKETLKTMTSPCGLPCFHCAAYLAKENPEIKQQLVAVLGVSPDKAACNGCRPQEGRIPVVNSERTCEIVLCISKKGIDFCNQCDDFPCGRFQPYADQSHFPHNTKMYQLCLMKKVGFEEWAEKYAAPVWDTYRTVPFSFDNILFGAK